MLKHRLLVSIAALLLASLACGPVVSEGPTLEPVKPVATPAPVDSGTGTVPQPQPQTQPSGTRSELSPDTIDRVTQAAVQIFAMRSRSDFQPMWTGSGTIISPQGEILTNCHVACGAPVLQILITSDPALPPEPRYYAEIRYYDEELDLALLEIVSDVNGGAPNLSGLSYLEIGDSDALRLGDPIRVFGYPGVGGETITFTAGSVSGFESATVGGRTQRVIIKTDADIASGNSGGTAVDLSGRLIGVPTWVNPDVREGVTIGGIGVLRPINLLSVVRSQPGAPPVQGGAGLPPTSDPDPYEPNDNADTATPLAPGQTVQAYISWEGDIDAYYIDVTSRQPISVSLTGIPSGTDYDLYLLDSDGIVAASESQTPQESIEYNPPAAGPYWVVVASYSGASTTAAYTLSVGYDGGVAGGPAGGAAGGIVITGQAIEAATRQPLAGGTFGLLQPGTTCGQFFGSSSPDLSRVAASAETNTRGIFTLLGVPVGQVYSAFFVYGDRFICEDSWLDVPADATDSDLGVIEMAF
ncbi:MAG: hypothetical protein Kow00124_05830 [Anaerolineae bacterium]